MTNLVDADTRSKFQDRTQAEAEALSAALRSPKVAPRWYETLMSMSRSVESQLAAKGRDTKARTSRLRASGKDREATEMQADHDGWAFAACHRSFSRRTGSRRRRLVACDAV